MARGLAQSPQKKKMSSPVWLTITLTPEEDRFLREEKLTAEDALGALSVWLEKGLSVKISVKPNSDYVTCDIREQSSNWREAKSASGTGKTALSAIVKTDYGLSSHYPEWPKEQLNEHEW